MVPPVVKPGGGINGKKIGPEVSEPVGRSESQLSSTVSKIYCHREFPPLRSKGLCVYRRGAFVP